MRDVARIADYRDLGIDLLSGIRDGALSGSENVGEAIMQAIGDAASNYAKKITDRMIEDLVTSGMKALGLDDIGVDTQTVASMQVTAASVTITGSIGAAADPAGAVTRMFSPANDGPPRSLSGIGSPLAGGYGNDLVSNARQLASNIGANPRDVLALMSFESGLRPDIWGGAGGRHYGLIQAGAAERAAYGIRPGGSLADQFTGIEAYFKDRGFKAGMGGLDLYSTVNAGRPGRYNASDAANGGTWGTVADKWNFQMSDHFARADRLLGESATRLTRSFDAVNTGAIDATSGLGTFGKGLGQVGNLLSQASPTSAGGGGGGFFGGVANMIAGIFGGPNTYGDPIGADPWGGLRIPSYAGGTSFHPGGLAEINEYRRGEIVNLPQGAQVIPHDVSMEMARNMPGAADRRAIVNINNYAGMQVETEEDDDGTVNVNIRRAVTSIVTQGIEKRGDPIERALRHRGLRRPGPRY